MTSLHHRTLATALLAMFLATACDDESGLTAQFWSLQSARLQAAVETWNENEPARYSFDYRRGCFCSPDVTAPVRITVELGEIVSIVYLEDVRFSEEETIPAGDPVTEFARGTFGTVDDLFADIARTIERRPVEFEVEYSPEFGYPVHRRSVECRCPDSGFVEEVLAFEVLP